MIKSPVNQLVPVNTNLTLDCLMNTTSAIRWERYNTTSNRWYPVWNGANIIEPEKRPNYHVTIEISKVTQQSQSRLMIASIQTSDGGLFACKEAGQNVKFVAEVIVTCKCT